jgi:hypothetical protein
MKKILLLLVALIAFALGVGVRSAFAQTLKLSDADSQRPVVLRQDDDRSFSADGSTGGDETKADVKFAVSIAPGERGSPVHAPAGAAMYHTTTGEVWQGFDNKVLLPPGAWRYLPNLNETPFIYPGANKARINRHSRLA